MIKGVHTMFYSSQPEALRAFIRDKLGFPFTDVGEGWLIDTLTGVGTPLGSTGVSGLLAIAMRSDSLLSGIAENFGSGIPISYALHQNYPNHLTQPHA
jgi:hypothetical protein